MRTEAPVLAARQAHQRAVDFSLLAATIAVLVGGLVLELALEADSGAIATAAVFALAFAVIFLLGPRRLEVWPDRLVVVFALWRWRLPFETVADARKANLWSAIGYWGVRLSTAPAASIELRRVQSNVLTRPNLIISPEGCDEFLRVLQEAVRHSDGRVSDEKRH
jgi:hypothetical protein